MGVRDLSSLCDLLPCFRRGGAVGTLRGFVNVENVSGVFADPDDPFTADITDEVKEVLVADWVVDGGGSVGTAFDWLLEVGALGAIRFGDRSLRGTSGANKLLSLALAGLSKAFNGPIFCRGP